VRQALGARVVQGYGLTETTNFATTMPPGLTEEASRLLVTEAEIPSAGVALAGNEVAVLLDDGSLAEPGEAGEICMRGHNIMSRYVGNTQATAAAFAGGWFHSGDLGYQLAVPGYPDPFLVITGRAKNIAKVGAESVSLDEIDRQLRELPGIRDGACVSVPSRFLGEDIIAGVVLAGQGESQATMADVAAVRDKLREVLPAAALPRDVVVLSSIPRTPTGKIKRPDLAGLVTALSDGAS
jgi:acyl-CoA synthetase (AMP-forming)/AMP-acid ligase II